MSKPYVVKVNSTKGGVGKSVLAVNIAVSLQLHGYDTLIVDTDVVNPSVGIYMGIEDVNVGLNEVLKGKTPLSRAVIPHAPSGVRVLPQRLDVETTVDKGDIDRLFSQITKTEYKFVVVDTQAGLQYPEAVKWFDEALIVTTPYEASCVSALKLINKYRKASLRIAMLVNRVKHQSFELSMREIEEMCAEKISGVFEEDDSVKIGTAQHVPTYMMNRRAQFSKETDEVASMLISRTDVAANPKGGYKDDFVSNLKRKLGR